MNVLFYSSQPYDKTYFNRFGSDLDLQYAEAQLNAQTARLAKGFPVICAFVNDQLNATVLETLKAGGTELVALRCAGYNNVDLPAAAGLGIRVVRVPAYSPHAVAEFAVALLLTLNRKTHKAYNRVRDGNFSLDRLTGFDLAGKTVGVVGTGQIGQVFCTIMKGFGCRVLAFDLIANRELEAAGVEYLPLLDLLALSDIISLHCPLNEQTRHLINQETLHHMKRGAMLLNTGRGALIDTAAVISALQSGQLGYLGIDVYEQEEHLFFYNRSEEIIRDEQIMLLTSFPNVLVTSHQGFFTEEALSEIAHTTLNSIRAYFNKQPLIHEIRR
ncbi:2-hydroxyacid dehydrogenase [Flavihumibacter sp. CACIAM 22H1]|uniref:2-hydroxyacid dehydrogenase n=1 Tax=Flavihumibacter sp. CACIAM 22H1 TaxID=1812911 RepID=UPI0007A8E92B|nr:2-hydroxyacid dehydrogenase [Flavihumibacter sp. CACIAM 22H1]KYP13414.1 MAG: hydroxyacid dehydrogenase [Flavihumibacter sp. CACIAM 22H1]